MEEKDLKKQIALLKEYGVNNYPIKDGVITINGSLDLRSLTTVDKDFLKGTTINGYLYLSSLTTVDKDFLKGMTINGSLDLRSLTTVDKDLLNRNVKQIKSGYSEKGGYCFYDGILRKVLKVSFRKEFTIYTTPSDFVVQNGKHTAHGKTVKQAIKDCVFKSIVEKIKNDPIKKTTIINIMYYRTITGACESGCRSFMMQHNIEDKDYKAVDAFNILDEINKKQSVYGFNKFKSLVTF